MGMMGVAVADGPAGPYEFLGHVSWPDGDGSIDFKAVRRALECVGYSGWVSIESSGWTDAEHSAIMERFFSGKL